MLQTNDANLQARTDAFASRRSRHGIEIIMDRTATLLDLAASHEEHLLKFVQCNNRIFLDPTRVGDMRRPLPEQLECFLRSTSLDDSTLDDIEHALRTGVVAGAVLCEAPCILEARRGHRRGLEALRGNWREWKALRDTCRVLDDL